MISSSQQPLFGARATSMANASASESPDVMSMYSNPASLSYIDNHSVAITAMVDWKYRSLTNLIAVPIRLNSGEILAFGFSGRYDGDRFTDPFFKMYGLDIAVAQLLSPSFSLGASAQMRLASTVNSSLLATIASIGTYYSPSRGVSYALVLNNLGWGVNYNSEDPPTYLAYDKSPQKSLEVSASYAFPLSTREPMFRLCVANEKLLGSNDLVYKAGAEIFVIKHLFLRLGVINIPSATYVNFGFGLLFDGMRIDYAAAPSISAGRYHQMTLFLPLEIGFGPRRARI
jgi:hypothetical protein